jgi:hypothetical protein
VLTKDEREARKAIMLLVHELRSLHLNLQEAKTQIILEPDKILEEIGSEEEDKIRIIDYEFIKIKKSKRKAIITREVVDRYKKVTKNGRAKRIDVSKFRWCINKFIEAKSDKALNFILNRIVEMPFLADLMFRYLSLFANRKQVKNGISSFLISDDNIYDWQEMWLILALSKSEKTDKHQLDIIRNIAKDKGKHWAPRMAAIWMLGRLGDSADRKWAKEQYYYEDNTYIKRAIAISIHNSPKVLRNKFYSEIESDSNSIARLVKYLRQDKIETI